MKKERVRPYSGGNKYACHLIKHLQMGFLIIAGNNFVFLKEVLLWKKF
ncbi:MAG: hypothetical protein LBC64_06140 [Fibromonadaceae bacterium]|nr:hypothetical protein [Fibromonadaceae bacterium]